MVTVDTKISYGLKLQCSHTHKKGKAVSIRELTKNPHYVVPSVFREAFWCWSSSFSIVS